MWIKSAQIALFWQMDTNVPEKRCEVMEVKQLETLQVPRRRIVWKSQGSKTRGAETPTDDDWLVASKNCVKKLKIND